MKQETIKLELIEWMTTIDNKEILQFIKAIKDSQTSEKDWWDGLSDDIREGINRGLEDVDEERVVSHELVKKKYGL